MNKAHALLAGMVALLLMSCSLDMSTEKKALEFKRRVTALLPVTSFAGWAMCYRGGVLLVRDSVRYDFDPEVSERPRIWRIPSETAVRDTDGDISQRDLERASTATTLASAYKELDVIFIEGRACPQASMVLFYVSGSLAVGFVEQQSIVDSVLAVRADSPINWLDSQWFYFHPRWIPMQDHH